MIAVGAHFCVRTAGGSPSAGTDKPSGGRVAANPACFSGFRLKARHCPREGLRCGFRSTVIHCSSYAGSSGGRSGGGEEDQDYLPATLLVAESVSHYRMLQQGHQEEVKWPISRQFHPFSMQVKGPRAGSGFISENLLRGFPSPTLFLKVTCNGDFMLPIIVGDHSIEKLIDALQGDDTRNCPDLFQLLKDLPMRTGYKVRKLIRLGRGIKEYRIDPGVHGQDVTNKSSAGKIDVFEVEMARITKRVGNTYYARLYFSKIGTDEYFSVDARPSDAINVAYRCQVPVYVSKQIVLMDAIRIGYGADRTRDAKPVYDVSLDSAPEGPDVLVEELDLVRSMNLAIKEERYIDAAMWRDKLTKLRKTKT